MTADEKHKHEYFRRIRRAKKWLRPLPRRATIHRYPVLGWFADTARRRSYLWSFRREDVVPAIYVGCILCMLPIYGIQVPIAFFLAILFRCNLMMMVGTQFITNPFTAGPLYLAACIVGLHIFYLFGTPIPGDNVFEFAQLITQNLTQAFLSIVGPHSMRESMEQLSEQTGMSLPEIVGLGFKATFVGGAILGYFIGFIFSLVYQFGARRASMKMIDLRTQYHKIRLREAEMEKKNAATEPKT
ncbi:MAG: DUF2062 domain-containing protein [Puniceicoccales bacterium]